MKIHCEFEDDQQFEEITNAFQAKGLTIEEGVRKFFKWSADHEDEVGMLLHEWKKDLPLDDRIKVTIEHE